MNVLRQLSDDDRDRGVSCAPVLLVLAMVAALAASPPRAQGAEPVPVTAHRAWDLAQEGDLARNRAEEVIERGDQQFVLAGVVVPDEPVAGSGSRGDGAHGGASDALFGQQADRRLHEAQAPELVDLGLGARPLARCHRHVTSRRTGTLVD